VKVDRIVSKVTEQHGYIRTTPRCSFSFILVLHLPFLIDVFLSDVLVKIILSIDVNSNDGIINTVTDTYLPNVYGGHTDNDVYMCVCVCVSSEFNVFPSCGM
jgi:hypothetical protein